MKQILVASLVLFTFAINASPKHAKETNEIKPNQAHLGTTKRIILDSITLPVSLFIVDAAYTFFKSAEETQRTWWRLTGAGISLPLFTVDAVRAGYNLVDYIILRPFK